MVEMELLDAESVKKLDGENSGNDLIAWQKRSERLLLLPPIRGDVGVPYKLT